MDLSEFLKRYRKSMQYSGRILSEKMDVSKHLLEKWENAGYTPNASDTKKLKRFFGLKNIDNITEETLRKSISGKSTSIDQKLKEKDSIIKEKDKRIRDLEKLVAMQEEKIQLMKGIYKIEQAVSI